MIPSKETRKCRKEMIVLQQMVCEQLDIPYLTPPTKMNLRWIINPNITTDSFKVLRDTSMSLN